jgi:hypothetical protein
MHTPTLSAHTPTLSSYTYPKRAYAYSKRAGLALATLAAMTRTLRGTWQVGGGGSGERVGALEGKEHAEADAWIHESGEARGVFS